MNQHREVKITVNGKTYTVRPSMQILAEIEDVAGSVIGLGQDLLTGQVKLTTIFNVVRLLTAGKVTDEDLLSDHKGCIDAVKTVILAILNVPLNNAGEPEQGEAQAQHA